MKKALALALVLCLLLACLPLSASAAAVVLSSQNLSVDGKSIDCEKYNIDGSNYFKLRDLAALLRGTPAEFDVSYDAAANAVVIAPGLPYQPVGGELAIGADNSASAVPSAQTIWCLDAPVEDLSVFNIGGSNFFKLRDLATLLGFIVDYDPATNTAIVVSSAEPSVTGSEVQAAAFDGLWAWIDANYNSSYAGDREFYYKDTYDDGSFCEFAVVDANMGEEKSLLLWTTYAYGDGAWDDGWIFLSRDTQEYFFSYDYYEVGNESTEADFTGDVVLSAAAFDGSKLVTFDSVSGAQSGDADYYAYLATYTFADMLARFQELCQQNFEPLDFYSVSDFGFTPAALNTDGLLLAE